MQKHINLDEIATVPTEKITEEEVAKETKTLIERLSKIQNKLFAQRKYAILIVLQGMDTSGKDGAVEYVFTGVNPAGSPLTSSVHF